MRTVLLALALLCLAAPLEARKPRPATPKSNPGTWVVTDDYPASALREDAQGVVRFRLTVGRDGRPIDCTVTRSSGNQALDDTACSKVVERGQFKPATDAKGRPVRGVWSSSVRWTIPDVVITVPPPGFAATSFIVETDGTISDCRIEKAEGALARNNPGVCTAGAKVAPILDASGKPVRKRVRVLMRVEQEDVAP